MRKSKSLDKRCDGEQMGSSREPAKNSISPLFRVSTSEDVVPKANAVLSTVESEKVLVPQLHLKIRWWEFFKRRQIKKNFISQRLEEYAKPVKIGNAEHKPTEKEVQEYEHKLKWLTIKELQLMGTMKFYQLKLDVLDRLKSIKKKHAVVTVFNDNRTTDTGVVHCYDRTFSRGGMTYLIISDRGFYDPEFRMMHFYYFANNPFPQKLDKPPLPPDLDDAKLLDSTIEAKVIEALAAIDIDKKINFILVLGIITFILCLINMLISIRGFKII